MKEVADLAIEKAEDGLKVPELRWSAFLGETKAEKKASKHEKPKHEKKKKFSKAGKTVEA